MSGEADKSGRVKGEKGYHKILGWQRAHSLVLLTYELTEKFPRDERFGLTRQLRDAVVSVPANIVEGYARGTSRQYHYHPNVAWGSLAEVEYYLELALDLKYIDAEQYESSEALRRETAYLLRRLMDSIARRQKNEQERTVREAAVPYDAEEEDEPIGDKGDRRDKGDGGDERAKGDRRDREAKEAEE